MNTLGTALQTIRPIDVHRPWCRFLVDAEIWSLAVAQLADGSATLLSLWSDGAAVHMAVMSQDLTQDPTQPVEQGAAADLPVVRVLSLDVPDHRFPSLGQRHPPALRLERTLRDLYGIEAEGSPDRRPWLDHGRWGVRHPLGEGAGASAAGPYAFLPAEGAPLHQIPVGPVHAGIIEPGHFRFFANGETVVRLEERLGYVHKGIDRLLVNAPLERAAKLAGRVSGDSTVAYGLAFSRAVEAACGVEAPPRAVLLRALMAELERIANHFGDIGAVCNDASFSLMHAHCGVLRERVLRAADVSFGHRLMMDRVVPGGVSVDLTDDGSAELRALLGEISRRFPNLIDLYDNTTSVQDRTVGTGILRSDLARQYGCGGFVGRASGRTFDARRTLAYPPYDVLRFSVAGRRQGDVDARLWIRIDEINQSVSLIAQILDGLSTGPIMIENAGSGFRSFGEGMALVEGFRGDVLAWVRLNGNGTVAHCHLRDPSWFQWPLLEAAIEGNIVADFPLCNKSFNCSYSGHDL